MKTKIIEIFNDFYPEIIGLMVLIFCTFGSFGGWIGFASSEVTTFSSVVLQILATYVGLILTAYTIFHGMKINGNDFLLEKLAKLSASDKQKAEGLLDSIHKIYIQNIQLVSCLTIVASLIYFFSLTSSGKLKTMLQCENPEMGNAIIISFLVTFIIVSTLQMVSAVSTLFQLRRL